MQLVEPDTSFDMLPDDAFSRAVVANWPTFAGHYVAPGSLEPREWAACLISDPRRSAGHVSLIDPDEILAGLLEDGPASGDTYSALACALIGIQPDHWLGPDYQAEAFEFAVDYGIIFG